MTDSIFKKIGTVIKDTIEAEKRNVFASITIDSADTAVINQETTINFSASSAFSTGVDITGFFYSIDDSDVIEVSATNDAATIGINFTGNTSDTRILSVYAIDELGNTSSTITKNLTLIDTYIVTPSITSPTNGATNVIESITITSSSFSVIGNGSDTHESSDWQIATDVSFSNIIEESLSDTTNKTSYPFLNPSTSTTYYVRVRYSGTSLGLTAFSEAISYTTAASFNGEQSYTTPGTYNWLCPTGVTSISVVTVGGGGAGCAYFGSGGTGGGLGWKNNITVVPGQQYTVVVGSGGPNLPYSVSESNIVAGSNAIYNGGNSYFIDTTTVCGFGGIHGGGNSKGGPYSGGVYVGEGGGNGGGTGGAYSTLPAQYQSSGGGGAGGYSGNGGNGAGASTANTAITISTAGTGGGGGGAGSRKVNTTASYGGAGGGGVGIFGAGVNGTAGIIDTSTVSSSQVSISVAGGGGSGGNEGSLSLTSSTGVGGAGGLYGGAGGPGHSGNTTSEGGNGANGAVRIIWGSGRSFPTNAA